MSILYSNNFNYQLEEQLSNHQQQQQHNLMRHRSAPSSFLENLSHGGGGGGNGSEDYHSFRPSSPEMDAILSRFTSGFNGSNCEEYEEKAVMKQEIEDSNRVYSVINSMKMNTSVNGFNLARQHTSPPHFFSDLPLDNGFAMTKMGFRVSNGFNRESNTSTSTLGNHLNFSSGQRTLPQIGEIGDDNLGASNTERSRGKELYMDFANNLASNDFKRLRDNDGNVIKVLENQDGRNFGNRSAGLTQHLSLPNTPGEMAASEKYLQFQGSVPCKIRAKRGFATHPRSIAERIRRTRISERMRKLQELFPDMDKQVNTADMLDLAVKYIKDLQKQVKTLADTKSKCTCSSKQKLYASA